MVNNKILLFLLLGLFMVSFTSAFDWDDSIISYYKLDNTTGVVYDMLGINDGTNNGATRGVAGKINNSFDFDGSNDYVEIVDDGSLNFGTGDFSFSLWTKFDNINGHNIILSNADYTSTWTGLQLYSYTGTSDVTLAFNNVGAENSFTASNGVWYNLVAVRSGSTMYFYKDGVMIGSGVAISGTANTPYNWFMGRYPADSTERVLDGNLDEIGFWNRALTQDDITELYNDGNGLPYDSGEIITVTLESPPNDTTIADIGTNFTVSGDVTSSFNATNITYYIWENTTLHNKTTVALGPSQTFNETIFIDNFTLTDYIWNAEVCYENSTFSNCTFAENNLTFSVNIFKDIASDFSSEITEGALNSINRTINVFPGNILTGALLEYNGTNYSTSLIFSDGIYIVGATLIAPVVDIDTNFTFIFHYLINGIYYPSTTENQTVLNTLFGICGGVSNDSLLNLFLLDERTKINISGDIEINAEVVSMSSDEVVGTLNGSFSDVDNILLCFTPPSVYASYYLNAEIRYTSDDYVSELYYIQKSDLEDYPSNLSLFLLSQNDSTEFTVTYKNNAFILTKGAIIQLQRKYIGENIYETVEAPLTSDDGKAILHIDLSSRIYQASVVKDGEVLDFFDNIVFDCANELSGECTYSLDGTVNPNNDIPIEAITDFSYSISFNEINKTITVLFAVPSGTPSAINVLLEQKDMFGNTTACNTTVITSAGSITCDYEDSIEKSILELSISKNDVQLVVKGYVNDPVLDMDGMNFFIVFLFMISLVGMAISSPEWMMIISVMTLVISGTLLLVTGMNLVMGLGAIAWVVVAVGIALFKMAKQEDK